MRSQRTTGVAAAVLLMLGLPALAGELGSSFTLGRYVPGDCFLYVHAAHNPDSEFICAHWARVWRAARESGVGDELKKLFVGSLDAEQRADFDKVWTTVTTLLGGVKWGDLVQHEFVFAERFGGGPPIPDLLILMRPEEATLADNFAGLKSILQTAATAGSGGSLTEEKIHGAEVWSLGWVNVPLTLHLFRKDGIVGLGMQRAGVQDALELLAGAGSKPSILEAPQFKQAIAEVPSPRDELVFFDMKTMMGALRKFPDMIVESSRPPGEAKAQSLPQVPEDTARMQRLITRIMHDCDVVEYMVNTTETRGLQRLEHSVVRMQPDYKDKALGRILMNPKPIERFDRFIPVEATGFEVWSGIDWAELYRTILGVAKDLGLEEPPSGGKWAAFKELTGFDFAEDLLSWLGTETVSVRFKPTTVSPLGTSEDSVTLVRVKDAKLAAAKVDGAIQRVNKLLQDHGQAALMITPASSVSAEGFRNVTHPFVMMFFRLTVGVSQDWLILGSSESAVNQVLAAAQGKAKTVADNPRFRAEGIVPTGPVFHASFTDLSNLGNELSGMVMMFGFGGSFIPDEPGAREVKAIFTALGRLGPALAEINFYSSTSSVTTAEGLLSRTELVTTYKPVPPTTQPATTPKPGQ